MGFNERVHAYIAAKYYTYLVETFGLPAGAADGPEGHPGRSPVDAGKL